MSMARTKKAVSWVHQAAGLAATFHAQDEGRILAIEYTTLLGMLSSVKGQEPMYLVHIQATETESRGEYSWPIQEYWTVTRNANGTPQVDEATDEQIAQWKGK